MTPEVKPRGGCAKAAGWIVAAVIGLPVLVILFFGIWARVDDEPADQRIDFIVACQSAVRDRLKAPATAKFGPETSLDVQGSPAHYRLTGTIEAANSFGVPTRTAYTCTGAPAAPEVGIF